MLWEIVIVLTSLLFLLLLAAWSRRQRNCIGFFHPYCNDGGGGERVLWCAVQALLKRHQNVKIVVYSGDNVEQTDILAKAFDRFGIEVDGKRVQIVRLHWRGIVEARCYPYFTLIGQSLGAALLSVEALLKLTPSVFIDTMGCAFTYPVARYGFGCYVGCYVHYPTISTDMLGLVARREETYNNRGFISRSVVLTQCKLLYYRLFAWGYGWVGRCSHAIMCNSSWTRDHIAHIWRIKPAVVYPPCNTDNLQTIPLGGRQPLVISLGQFRPEKNHALQVEAMARLKAQGLSSARLAIIGSCRNAGDEERVRAVKAQIKTLGLEDMVEVHVNVPWSDLKGKWLSSARAGMHTMWNEHFGINVVEFMAAGVLPVAHNSAGPKEDIVVEWEGKPTGFLATTPEEYAAQIAQVMAMSEQDLAAVQRNARSSVARFSDPTFQEAFLAAVAGLVR